MREISLITGQLHRAIYNLNEEARRAANQKFESGLSSAPHRSLKKAFDQFRQSLQTGDPTVRRRTASLLVTLVRNFAAIPPPMQADVLDLIETGLSDSDQQVREATVESYSLMLPQIDESQLIPRETSTQSIPPASAPAPPAAGPLGKPANDAAAAALHRILHIAISDPNEIVREAAAVAVAVQKSNLVKHTGVHFFLNHVDDSRFRWACRSIQSLAEFPDHAPVYLDRLNQFLNDGHWRFRRAALLASGRLARLEVLPAVLLPNVVRRMFDAHPKISTLAQEIVQTSIAPVGRDNKLMSGFLTECLWLSQQAQPRQHLAAIVETKLVNQQPQACFQACQDRFQWRTATTRNHHDRGVKNESESEFLEWPTDAGLVGDAPWPALQTLIQRLSETGGRPEIGWVAGWIVGQSARS